MWIFTRYGFVSIGCARKPDGGLDENTVMIRARSRHHLDNLRKRFPGTTLATNPVLVNAGNDYKFRVNLPKAEWAAILSQLAMEQTWSNFKNEAEKFAGWKKASSRYVDVLHEIWAVLFDLQQRGEE